MRPHYVVLVVDITSGHDDRVDNLPTILPTTTILSFNSLFLFNAAVILQTRTDRPLHSGNAAMPPSLSHRPMHLKLIKHLSSGCSCLSTDALSLSNTECDFQTLRALYCGPKT